MPISCTSPQFRFVHLISDLSIAHLPAENNPRSNGKTVRITAAALPLRPRPATVHNNTCKICIEDNGIGASDEQIDRLNNTPHYMICDTNTAEQRHGLGLLIVKQIIKGHNGEIFIDHSEYGGFKVVLIIPK